ncbi:protein TIC 22, chloroplastic isoform X4 [Rhododendron vialii]|uniref:protein TIC 22, chloroplastic isoform X4 n=1 Tax=Rhododendron vialii TaxID=182163 RepID=UPI002660284E|nr:protein TIC 22, chloroplastic isoform X4 [Rhododendron vialii]
MDFPKPSLRSPNPILSLSSFIHQHCHRLGAELTNRLAATWPPRQKRVGLLSSSSSPPTSSSLPSSPFASVSQQEAAPRHVFDVALSSDVVSKTLAGTSVYTVSNSDNEFVLVSDPCSLKSIGLLCFRKEDAEAFLAQVKLRRGELQSRARVVPITLEQLKASNAKSGFDGVPVFQSDLLVVKKRNRRYCPIYFRKVGSLEDVLKKMEMNKTNSGWEDLIFIPPGKSHSQHIQEVMNT